MDGNIGPLRIFCTNCGAPAGFDILRQSYRCTSCGELTGIEEAKSRLYTWRRLKKEKTDRQIGQTTQIHACPACGANVVFAPGEASETCAFCGNRLVSRTLSEDEQMPDMILPFFITPEEAKSRLLAWGQAHEKTPEGQLVVSGIEEIQGYYLPYRLVRGPVSADVSRDASRRRYYCQGYLEGTAVNTSRQLDNAVLNGMEPFDWSAARPFEYGYIAGFGVKLPDADAAETEARVREEAAADFLPEVERVMQTTGVQVDVKTGDLMTLTALLPVYFIRRDNLFAVMNGQTGRIAVSAERRKKSFPWVVEPLVYTLILTLLLGLWCHFEPQLTLYGGTVLALLLFTIFGEGRASLIRSILMRTNAGQARRENGVLQIDEQRDILKNPYDNTPVFYEPGGQGWLVPVRIRFYTFGRCLSILLNSLVTVFLPAILAVPLRLVTMVRGERFLDQFHPAYGAAWYTLAALIVLVYLAKGARRDVYDHPYLYVQRPDGKKTLLGSREDRRVTVLSMFGVGGRDADGRRITLFRALRMLGKAGLFLGLGMLAILVGSTLAIFL